MPIDWNPNSPSNSTTVVEGISEGLEPSILSTLLLTEPVLPSDHRPSAICQVFMPAGSNGNNIGKSDSFSPPHRPSPRQLAALRRETQERHRLALENEDSYNDPNILRPRGTGCVPGRMDLGESPFGLSPDSMRKEKAKIQRIRPLTEQTAGCDACRGAHKAHTSWCKERLLMLGKPVKKSGPRKGEVLQYVQQANY